MKALNLPAYPFKLSQKNGKTCIYDSLRHKDIALTPEEWVRQHFVRFLITDRSYPPARIAHEVSINVNATSKRCDTVVYDDYLNPLVIIEFKAPDIPLNREVFDQITRYNSALRVPYLMVSNGLTHYCCHIDYQTQQSCFLEDIPSYFQLRITNYELRNEEGT